MAKLFVFLCVAMIVVSYTVACNPPGYPCADNSECCSPYVCNPWAGRCTKPRVGGPWGPLAGLGRPIEPRDAPNAEQVDEPKADSLDASFKGPVEPNVRYH